MIINIQLFGYPVQILWLSCSQRSLNYLVYFGVAYEGYSRNVSCALNEISTSLFLLVSEVAIQYSGSQFLCIAGHSFYGITLWHIRPTKCCINNINYNTTDLQSHKQSISIGYLQLQTHFHFLFVCLFFIQSPRLQPALRQHFLHLSSAFGFGHPFIVFLQVDGTAYTSVSPSTTLVAMTGIYQLVVLFYGIKYPKR